MLNENQEVVAIVSLVKATSVKDIIAGLKTSVIQIGKTLTHEAKITYYEEIYKKLNDLPLGDERYRALKILESIKPELEINNNTQPQNNQNTLIKNYKLNDGFWPSERSTSAHPRERSVNSADVDFAIASVPTQNHEDVINFLTALPPEMVSEQIEEHLRNNYMGLRQQAIDWLHEMLGISQERGDECASVVDCIVKKIVELNQER